MVYDKPKKPDVFQTDFTDVAFAKKKYIEKTDKK